jgi:homoserine kinase type II
MSVYTPVSAAELDAWLLRYAVGGLAELTPIASGIENTNYFVTTERGRYVLTLYERRVAESDLPYFIGLMEHLAARGIACPLPVRDRHGNPLGRLAGRPAAIVTFLQGLSVRRPSADHCAAVGHALADLHLAGHGFTPTRRNALSVNGWRPRRLPNGRPARRLWWMKRALPPTLERPNPPARPEVRVTYRLFGSGR